MAFVTIETGYLSSEAKKRLGDRVLYALQQEGVKPAETVIRFEPDHSSLYMDGTLVEAHEPIASIGETGRPLYEFGIRGGSTESAGFPLNDVAWKAKPRRSQSELESLKDKVRDLLRRDKALSSFQIQKKLGLSDCDWAPNTLRRMMAELLDAGEIRKTGEKRGTVYHWIVKETLPEVKLEKV